jgi:hypothetical protein
MHLLECGYCHKLYSEDFLMVIDHTYGHLCRHCAQVLEHGRKGRGYFTLDTTQDTPPSDGLLQWVYRDDD